MIYKASGFGFLPKQPSTAAFIERPARACSALHCAVCGLVYPARDRRSIDLRELCVLSFTCVWSALAWLLDRGCQRTHEGTNCTDLHIAPPNGVWVYGALGPAVRAQHGVRLSACERLGPSKSGAWACSHVQRTWHERHRVHKHVLVLRCC
jgi:hypothetical protein